MEGPAKAVSARSQFQGSQQLGPRGPGQATSTGPSSPPARGQEPWPCLDPEPVLDTGSSRWPAVSQGKQSSKLRPLQPHPVVTLACLQCPTRGLRSGGRRAPWTSNSTPRNVPKGNEHPQHMTHDSLGEKPSAHEG